MGNGMTPQAQYEQVAAARLGNREAFAALVEHYQGLVSAVALNIVGDFQQSEDIAQEAFLIAWNRLTELSEPAKFPAWLCGIARNCSNNWVRQQKRNPLAKSATLDSFGNLHNRHSRVGGNPDERLSSLDSRLRGNDGFPTSQIETETSDKTNAQLVWQSLSDIPETYREPMLMFYRHGAKISEIADALELTEEAVRQRLSRGRKLLKSEVERTVEKTLTATRPDVAFTVAVLAAIPLSATVGCSTSTKSVGFLGGVSAMSSIGSVLLFFVLVLLSAIPPLLFAAVCFYACWYAVKNSPTLRTRRFAISALLDMCVLLWLIWFAKVLINRYFMGFEWSVGATNYFPFLPYSAKFFLFHHLPLFLVFSTFIVYIVLRWRQLLCEDRTPRETETQQRETGTVSPQQSERGGDTVAVSLLAKTLEREISFVRNVVNNYRNSCLTTRGICVKRNIVLGLVALFCVYYIVKQSLLYAKAFSWHEFSSEQIVGALVIVVLSFLFMIALYAIFFRIISKAIGIAWDDAALEKSPPKIPLSQWNEAELQPEGRRQMLVDSVILLCMVPLILILMILGIGLAQELLFTDPKYTIMSLPQNLGIDRLIMFLVVLVVLTVLWCSYNPTKRWLGFARLFLAVGLLAFCYFEWQPFHQLVASYWSHGSDGMTVFGLSRWEMLSKMYLPWHLTAFSFLAYSLSAAGFCYLLRAGER